MSQLGDDMRKAGIEPGDAKAWEHGLSQMADILTHEERERLVLIACYTAEKEDGRTGGVPEAELEALIDWALNIRIGAELLSNVLAGSMFVRMKGAAPEFTLSPKGTAEAERAAEQMGLPPLERKPDDQ